MLEYGQEKPVIKGSNESEEKRYAQDNKVTEGEKNVQMTS